MAETFASIRKAQENKTKESYDPQKVPKNQKGESHTQIIFQQMHQQYLLLCNFKVNMKGRNQLVLIDEKTWSFQT